MRRAIWAMAFCLAAGAVIHGAEPTAGPTTAPTTAPAKQRAERPKIPDIDAYYYDLGTDKLFVATLRDLPPILVPGAKPGDLPMGARAFVFACGDCSVEANRYIGWIELYNTEAKAKLTAAAKGDDPPQSDVLFLQTIEQGHFIAFPDPTKKDWKAKGFHEFMSEQGNRIMQNSQTRCGEGVIPRNCMPADTIKK